MPNLIRTLKIKYPVTAILLIFITFILIASSVFAQEAKKERGYRGPITKKELFSKFKNGEFVEGYVIEGDDIIEIIRKTDYKIQILNSVIKGGLNFGKLPPELLSISLPQSYKVGREVLVKLKDGFLRFHLDKTDH